MSKVLQIDNFAETRGFEVQGQGRFPSIFGAILTFAITCCMFGYSLKKLQIMNSNEDDTYSEVIKRQGIDGSRMYSQSETKMGLLFYLLDINTGKMLTKEDQEGIFGDW